MPPSRSPISLQENQAGQRLRWLASFVGAAALAALGWYLGPLVSVADVRPLEEPSARLVFVAALGLAWVLLNLAADARERRANGRLVEALGLRSEPDRRATSEELTALREQAEAALKRLRTQRFGPRWGGRYAYQLPWYLLLGAPGAGKTTALGRAGLASPLPGGQPVPVMGGTRTCDWWFTDRAVIVDTAGRYTTQDSRAAVDAQVWSGLLTLVKQVRPRQPLNGLLIAVSASDLGAWSEPERRQHAAALRARLTEAEQALGIRLPVYLLLTKADLIEGFAAFFDDLPADERAQVWGVTLPPERSGPRTPAALADEVRQGFAALMRRIDERLIERLHQELDIQRRSAAFTFPLRLAGIVQRFGELAEALAIPEHVGEPAMLRGMYLTSAVPEEAATARAAPGGPAPALSAPGAAASSTFLQRLLPSVIFAEANLAGVDPRVERRRRLRHALATGGGLALAAGLCAFWAVSHQGNLGLVDRAGAAVDQAAGRLGVLNTPPKSLLRVDDTDFAAVLPALDALRTLPAGWQERGVLPPLHLTGGLYQGWRLGPPAVAVYARALRSIFLSRIVLRLEEQIRAALPQPDRLAPALRAYRMIAGQDRLDGGFLADWLAADWQRSLPGAGNAASRRALGDHLAALLEVGFAPIPADEVLLERARLATDGTGRDPTGRRLAP